MSVTLGVTPYSEEQTALWLLQSLGSDINDQAAITDWYLEPGYQPEGLLLLTYTRPEQVLQQALRSGESPVHALGRWVESAEAMIHCFKSNRGRAVLLELTAVSRHPEAALALLASKWSLEMESSLCHAPETTYPADGVNPFFILIADSLVFQNGEVRRLMTQLEACTQPVSEAASTDAMSTLDFEQLAEMVRTSEKERQQLTALTAELTEQKQALEQSEQSKSELKAQNQRLLDQLSREKDELGQQLTDKSEENQLLLNQLHLVQEELEGQLLDNQKQEQALKQLQQQSDELSKTAKSHEGVLQQELKTLKARLTEEQAGNKALKTETQVLAQQIETGKATVAKIEKQLQQEKAANKQVSSEKATLQGQLDNLQSTFIQLQTTQQNTEQQPVSLEEENQLLLEQLHLVQEELEQHFHQSREQEQTLESVKASLSNELRSTAEALATKEQEVDVLQRRLYKLHDRLDEVERGNRVLNGNIAELKNRIAAEHKYRADLEQKYYQSERTGTLALATANRRIRELSNELNNLTNSSAWKLVQPFAGTAQKAKLKEESKLHDQIMEVEASGLFDRDWYLSTYDDVAQSDVHPVEHYLKSGAYEGRNPSPTFDTVWYLSFYSDVNEVGINPLIHYIRFGRAEQRATRPGAVTSLPAPTYSPSKES